MKESYGQQRTSKIMEGTRYETHLQKNPSLILKVLGYISCLCVAEKQVYHKVPGRFRTDVSDMTAHRLRSGIPQELSTSILLDEDMDDQ